EHARGARVRVHRGLRGGVASAHILLERGAHDLLDARGVDIEDGPRLDAAHEARSSSRSVAATFAFFSVSSSTRCRACDTTSGLARSTNCGLSRLPLSAAISPTILPSSFVRRPFYVA